MKIIFNYFQYYKTFGLSPTPTEDEIKSAYRRLSMKYHPDVSKELNAEENMKTINAIYRVIGNKTAREEYQRVNTGKYLRHGNGYYYLVNSLQEYYNLNENRKNALYYGQDFNYYYTYNQLLQRIRVNASRKNGESNYVSQDDVYRGIILLQKLEEEKKLLLHQES